MKERLISFIRFANNRNLEYFNLLDIFMHLFRSIIHEGLNINAFKDKEGDRISVDNMHTPKSCGRELIDSPVVGVFHSPTIDAEYVFVSPNIVTLFDITLMNVYLVNNQEIN